MARFASARGVVKVEVATIFWVTFRLGVADFRCTCASTSSAQVVRVVEGMRTSGLLPFGSAMARGVNSGAPGFSLEPYGKQISTSQKNHE